MGRAISLMFLLMVFACAPGIARARAISVIAEGGAAGAREVESGIKGALADAGPARLKRFQLDFQNVGQGGTVAATVRAVVARKPDVIIAVGLAVFRAAAAAGPSIPLVYVVTGDSAIAALADIPGASGPNVIGVTDALDTQKRMALIKSLLPDAQRVGLIYDPVRPASDALVKRLRAALGAEDMTLVDVAVTRGADVGAAARSLIDRVDVIYTDDDDVVESGYDALVATCDTMKIPLVASTIADVKRGAAATLGIDFLALGRQAGALASRIGRGARPADVTLSSPSAPAVYVNLDAIARQGMTLPDEILETARAVTP